MKVLVPVDGSENSMRAVDYVLNMVKTNPTVEVTLLAVACHYDALYLADSFVGEEVPNQECKDLFAGRLYIAKKIFDDAGVPVTAELLAGDPGKVIVSYVEEKGIDKVVMGSRGLGPLMGMVLGSVTHKVLNSVRVPMTIIK